MSIRLSIQPDNLQPTNNDVSLHCRPWTCNNKSLQFHDLGSQFHKDRQKKQKQHRGLDSTSKVKRTGEQVPMSIETRMAKGNAKAKATVNPNANPNIS